MLVGHPPFEALTALDVVQMHTSTPPRPPREVDEEVPEPVSRLVLKLMAKNPEGRPRSADLLVERISEVRREVDRGLIGLGEPEKIAARASKPQPEDGAAFVIREVLGPEGRTYRRVPVDMVATARSAQLPDDTRKKLVAKVLNVSQGGLFLACDEPLPAGSLMELSFRPAEDADMVEGLAVVRWTSDHPTGMGLEFVRLSESERERIGRMVARTEARLIIKVLTRTELHQRLLRSYYTNMVGRSSLAEIAARADTTVVMVREGLKPFVQYGLAQLFESRVEFRPPRDEELSRRIKRWVLEHGLA
jgi:uncharacterized protein (TIGR02266 family)